ncbi:odorant receptor 9a-like [Anopheles marshallii]|uniref:odorant receptor 9a-like n=1 Tax=Anopheles marshallii TaxID=1521116 RepID=UPI00237B60FF|nr:odorant receptor 9a-like [Anopheles marshallii]
MARVEDFLDAQMSYLRYCGVFRDKSTLAGMRLNVCLGVLVVFMVLQSIYVFQHVNHFAMICDVIPTLVVCMVAISKFYIFVFRPAAMFALIDSFKTLQRRATVEDLLLFRRSGAFHAKLTKIYMTSALIVGWFYILSAVVTGIFRSMSEGRVQFVAPMAFPHNYQHPLMFALTFLFNCDSIHMSIFISGSVDTCFSELAASVTIHFRLIQHRFQTVDFAGGAGAEAELERVVAYHKDVLQLGLAVTGLFQYTVFYLLLLDSVLLCIIGYQFVLFMNTPRVLMLASMAFVMVLQAVIYCYHGSMMHDESLKVADAIYQSNWYEARPAVQRLLRLCMMRAQKPIVTKGGFMKATLPTLKKILNSTGSYITMLLSLETEPQQ